MPSKENSMKFFFLYFLIILREVNYEVKRWWFKGFGQKLTIC